jgi:hypothetical protein
MQKLFVLVSLTSGELVSMTRCFIPSRSQRGINIHTWIPTLSNMWSHEGSLGNRHIKLTSTTKREFNTKYLSKIYMDLLIYMSLNIHIFFWKCKNSNLQLTYQQSLHQMWVYSFIWLYSPSNRSFFNKTVNSLNAPGV